jgi:hypothetical protein
VRSPRRPLWLVYLVLASCLTTACGSTDEPDREAATSLGPPEGYVPGERPERFTIVPDDYHVPYAGTAEDGRRFFLSEELFGGAGAGTSYVALFLWQSDGTFDELRVDEVARPEGVPPGQAAPAGAEDLVEARLAELGDYALEPIVVEPFTRKVDGVVFGWRVVEDAGSFYVNIEPGDFIAYYEPWDGLEYDT